MKKKQLAWNEGVEAYSRSLPTQNSVVQILYLINVKLKKDSWRFYIFILFHPLLAGLFYLWMLPGNSGERYSTWLKSPNENWWISFSPCKKLLGHSGGDLFSLYEQKCCIAVFGLEAPIFHTLCIWVSYCTVDFCIVISIWITRVIVT